MTALSWLYVYRQMGAMEGMADIAMPADIRTLDRQRLRPQHGDLVGDDAGHDAAQRRTDDPDLCRHQPAQAPARPAFVPTAVFTAGYLIAWGLFGVFATSRIGGSNALP